MLDVDKISAKQTILSDTIIVPNQNFELETTTVKLPTTTITCGFYGFACLLSLCVKTIEKPE
jgi:hypothetical protein